MSEQPQTKAYVLSSCCWAPVISIPKLGGGRIYECLECHGKTDERGHKVTEARRHEH